MPNVHSFHTKRLKLAGPVVLPPATKSEDEKGRVTVTPGETVKVDKKVWKRCLADKHTQQFMARGLVKLAPASPQPPKAKAATKPTSKPPPRAR